MATNVVATQNRQDPRQVVNTLKKIVNFNDPALALGSAFSQYLPQGAFITRMLIETVTAFNGGATISVGTVGPGYTNMVPATSFPAAAVLDVTLPLGRSLAAAGDVLPAVKLNAGTPTTGQMVILITYEGGWAS